MEENLCVICREGKLDDLVPRLAAHRLDMVLADEPASASVQFKMFNQSLGLSGTSFCASRKIASRLRQGFPASLNEAPALLPGDSTPFRRALENWFRSVGVQPEVVAEFDDLALMKVMASEGRGFIAVPSIAVDDAVAHYKFQLFGEAPECHVSFYGITAERRIDHAAVAHILKSGPSSISH